MVRGMAGNERKKRVPRKATPKRLERAAEFYLQRFATSSANLHRVLMNRVTRSARIHGTDSEEGREIVEALIRRYENAGILDDRAYAAAKARGLTRRGTGRRAIRARLAAKGVASDDIEAALGELDGEFGNAEMAAAVAYARRRRLGPWRPAPLRSDYYRKDLAAMARAGFGFDVAETVLKAESPESLIADVEPDFR